MEIKRNLPPYRLSTAIRGRVTEQDASYYSNFHLNKKIKKNSPEASIYVGCLNKPLFKILQLIHTGCFQATRHLQALRSVDPQATAPHKILVSRYSPAVQLVTGRLWSQKYVSSDPFNTGCLGGRRTYSLHLQSCGSHANLVVKGHWNQSSSHLQNWHYKNQN